MNTQIKTILEKNNIAMINDVWVVTKSDLQNAIIEICEEQKNQCSIDAKMLFHDGHHKTNKRIEYFQSGSDNVTISKDSILNSKNISE